MARAVAAAGVSVTLALWLATVVFGVQAWWVELLRYLPYPFYLVPAVLAVAASVRLGWVWRSLAAAALALVLTGVMDLCWGAGDRGEVPLRLMTWNAKAFVHGGARDRDHRIALEILEHDPDVVVLQDADAYGQPGQALPAPIAAVLRGRALFVYEQYLVASRVPMRDCRVHRLPVGQEPRPYVTCTLTAGGTDVDLVTVHLFSPRAGLNAARREWLDGGLADWRENYAERLQQAHLMLKALAGHPRPLIVAGDLNATESSPVLRALKAMGLRDAFSAGGRGYGYTLGHALRPGFSFLRIDHILVAPSIGVHDSFVGGRDASEHRPVIADLWIRRH